MEDLCSNCEKVVTMEVDVLKGWKYENGTPVATIRCPLCKDEVIPMDFRSPQDKKILKDG